MTFLKKILAGLLLFVTFLSPISVGAQSSDVLSSTVESLQSIITELTRRVENISATSQTAQVINTTGTSWYVSPTGSSAGDGSQNKPWNFETAINAPTSVKPGDTIWVMGGEYKAGPEGYFRPRLKGAEGSPIIVRAMPGQRVTLIGSLDLGLRNDEYTWWWGFEIKSKRMFSSLQLAGAAVNYGKGVKLINNIIHDNEGGGVALWKNAVGPEAYGNVVYNNGIYTSGNRGSAHGFYIQSFDSGFNRHVISDNIVFRNYNNGLQLSGETPGQYNNVTVEGNTFFNNGELAYNIDSKVNLFAHNWVIAPTGPANNIEVVNNYGYTPSWAPVQRYKAHQLVNSKITGNYMISSGPTTDAALDLLNPSGLTMTGNTMLGLHYRFNESDYPTNTYLSQRPTSGSWVFVRPNKYEAGRGNITIYNWAKSPTVDVDLSKAGLPVNTEYEIRNAQDFFATPVLSGRYSGGTVAVPMSDLSVAAPIQPLNTQPTKTSPEFGAFVVLPKGILPPPTPNPTPTPTPSPVIPNPPVITPPNPTPTPTPTPNTGTLAIGSPVEATEYLNVRSGPSTTNTVIETVTPSTRGIIVDGPQVGSGYTWWKVLFYNNSRPTGWVAQNFLKISSTIYVPPVVTPTPTPTPTPNPTPTPIPVPSPAPVQTGTGQTLYNGIVLPSVWPPKRSATLDVLEPWYVKNPPAVVNIDIGRQLFVDDFLVESTTLSRTQHKPVMHPGNPIIYPPNVGEANIPFGDGVWYDPADSTFKMWYMCPKAYSVQLCYAYSSDGKTWTKHKNNPIFVNTSAGARDSSTIWMDLNDIPSRKFKMFSFTGGKTVQQYFSADGITWVKQPTVIESVSDRTTFFYNPFRQVWVESERDDFYVQNRPERNMTRNRSRNYIETPNPMSWDYSKRVFWMGVDNNDPPYVGTQIYPQLYNFDAIAYESVMLGFRSMYYPEPSPRLVELNLGFSRDGFTWTNPTKGSADKAFIAATNKDGDWNGFNTQSVNGGVIIVGDELYIYFSGRSARHGDAFETHKMGAGLATLRRDGFYSMDAGSSEGVLTTKTLKFSGGNMFVNVNNPNGSLQVEVLDENNNVIAPFTKSNSQVVKTDSTKTSITWNGANLSSLAGKNVKFRFYLTNGKLYSFWVTPSAQGASFGYVAAGGPGFTSDRDTNGVNVPPPTPTPTPVPVPTPTPVPNPVPTPVPNPTPVPVNPVPTPLPIVGSPIITNTTSNRLSSGTRATNISVRTDSQSSCRYSYRADIGFSGMTLAMTSTDGINHQVRVDGLNDDSNYVYYVRCQKNGGLANNIDFKIHLYVSALGGQTSNFSYQLFEAESGSVTSPMKVINDNSASGLAYIKSDISNSGSATYTVNVPTKGVYTLWGRVLSIDGTRDSVLIQVDSQPVDVWDLSENTWSNSWQWSRVTSRNANNGSPSAYNIKPKQISLEAGSHTITISGRDAGAIVDRMLLTNDLAFIASDSSTATITSTNVTPIPPPVPTPTPVTPTPTPTPTPVTPAPTPNPPVITPPTLPVDNTATTLSVGAGIEATAYLNVRSAPSITAPVIETITALTRGVVVEGPQLSNGYTWWKVSFFNNTRPTGWVAQNYIKLASGVVTPTPTPTPTPVPVIPTPVPTPTPISTTTASSGNTLSIEAESGSLVGRMRLLYYGSSVSGENVIRTDTENSGSASYNFNINTSKSYVVWARVLTNSSTQNSLRISIDGNSVDWNIPVTGNSWAWVKVSDQNGSTKIWDMNSGNHSLVVYGMEANTQVDKFIITDDTNWTPSGIKGIVSIDNNSNVALIYATLEQIKAVLQGLLK